MTIHPVVRTALRLTAWWLGALAIVLLLLRLAMSQADALTPRIEALLEARVGVPVNIERLTLAFERNDIQLMVGDVSAQTPNGYPLFKLDHAKLRLDVWASLKALTPIFNDADIRGTEFHLYRLFGEEWRWPAPAKLPVMEDRPAINLAALDRWTGILLRQRLSVEDTRVVLHGERNTVDLHAPTLLLGGDDQRTLLEGSINIIDQTQDTPSRPLPMAHMQAEVEPGEEGYRDFSAALNVEIQLDHLALLADVLRPGYIPQITQAGGDAKLWGQWYKGQLDQARVGVDIPQLTLRHDVQRAMLKDVEALGQWQRDGDGGEAWLTGNAVNVEWAEPTGVSEGPALPRHWYLTHQPDDWQLRTSAFELASLAAWRDYILLPESVTRVLQTLAPRGQVEGLSLGQREGEWGIDAAISNLEALPWEQAPGGGPLDAWVQARDFRGRVQFANQRESTLYFPELFDAPMQLQHATGQVEWVYDGPRALVSGRDIALVWDGARVTGGFGLVTDAEQGNFGLDINFQDVDAVERPLAQWVPMRVLEPELREWLESDVGGYVTQGALKLSQPLGDDVASDEVRTNLDLTLRDGYLPIAPDWPQVDGLAGRLKWQNDHLMAEVERGQSQGVVLSDGALRLQDDALNLSGQWQASGQNALAFLTAIPDSDLPGLEQLDLQGDIDGDIALAMSLDNEDDLALEVNAAPREMQVGYGELAARIEALQGQLTWQQQGEQNALIGQLNGQLWDGVIEAAIDTRGDGVELQGEASSDGLLRLAGLSSEAAAALAEGRSSWQGRLTLSPAPKLALESDWQGMAIKLPAPFTKSAQQAWPWTLTADLDPLRIKSRLADIADLHVQSAGGELAGNVRLGRASRSTESWRQTAGWQLAADVERLDIDAWQTALSPIVQGGDQIDAEEASISALPPLSLSVTTSCVVYKQDCLGGGTAEGDLHDSNLSLMLDSDLVRGRVDYRPSGATPLDIALSQLSLDPIVDAVSGSNSEQQIVSMPSSWTESVETTTPEASTPMALPAWLADVPNGRLRLSEMLLDNKRIGPLTAFWQADGDGISLEPVGLTLGQLTASGALHWEGGAATSKTRAEVAIKGGNIATALEHLDQPVAMRSRSTQVDATLAWPGAPWQLDLAQAGGEMTTDIRDGRFLTLESAPARLVGLLNFDNILRRLRLDFSDVTGQGTAFDRVHGSADIAEGKLMLRGPLQIEAPAATLSLSGDVDLVNRELDQRLGVALPLSQGLPMAAIAIGAPVVGGALFLADQMFGDALDQATTIYYRVEGPWASPQVTLEGSR
ncbi:YhdP family phospholipid transporter [Halomonas sp. HL-93]|uniref:YhdP family phospholipid transporter n=1 Tax=Halomonas sp. HL-93 TaxID=1666906 RepID=UPI0006DB2FEA|nr:AsmA-like C-terminal region-containing protein [Halomonas sp. HL-93]KPQ31002.1 MAG: putative membrane protein [Halomonas sp. HL-93]SBR49697.1 TIGR02099 family protein [Halomonas sp. HL-93]